MLVKRIQSNMTGWMRDPSMGNSRFSKGKMGFLKSRTPLGPPRSIMLTQSLKVLVTICHKECWWNEFNQTWLVGWEILNGKKRFSPVQRVRDNDITMICSVISDVLSIYVVEVRASINSIKLSELYIYLKNRSKLFWSQWLLDVLWC